MKGLIAFVGGIANSRSIRSPCYFWTKFDGVPICFMSPDVTKARDGRKQYLHRHNVWFTEITNPDVGLEK